MRLAPVDYGIIALYFVTVLGIGLVLKRRMRHSDDFLLAGRAVPAWAAGLAFIAANLGAQEVIGMAASGAKYGWLTSHFYWLGAIPAMAFVAIFMMPFYYGSRARSVPEYLRLRFDEKTRTFNAGSFAVMTILSSGISMFAMAKLFNLVLGWNMNASIWLSAVVVLGYIVLGGLTSAIYNEVLQFFLIVAGFSPLVWLGLRQVGGWHGMVTRPARGLHRGVGEPGQPARQPDGRRVVRDGHGPRLRAVVRLLVHRLPGGAARHGGRLDERRAAHAAHRRHPQDALPVHRHPAGADRPGADAAPGAGHRAAAAGAARRELRLQHGDPGDAGALLPGGAAGPRAHGAARQLHVRHGRQRDRVQHRVDLRPLPGPHQQARDRRALPADGAVHHRVGVALSVATAYVAMRFNNIMDMLQLVFSFVNAPLLATFLLGMFWRRTTGHGAFWGLLGGTAAAALHYEVTGVAGSASLLPKLALIHAYPSDMAQNFWGAIWAWSACFALTWAISLVTAPRAPKELEGLVYGLTTMPSNAHEVWYRRPVVLAVGVLTATIALNILFW